jgi:hypothetical protein
MQILKDLTPNELFRFVNVRGPLKQEEKPSRAAFVPLVYDTLSQEERKTTEENCDLLYPALADEQGKPDQLARSQRLVARYKSGKDFIASPDSYLTSYSELSAFIAWLDVSADFATPDAVAGKFKTIFNVSLQEYTATDAYAATRLRIWDNLFANLFVATDAFLVTLACKYLGTLNLIDLLAQGTAPDQKPGTVYRSRPLVPKWIVTLAASIDRKPDEGVDDQAPPVDNSLAELKSRYLKLVSVISELSRLLDRKRKTIGEKQEIENNKFFPVESRQPLEGCHNASEAHNTSVNDAGNRVHTGTPDPLQIDSEDLRLLNRDTLALLTELLGESSTYNLDQLLGIIKNETVGLGSAIGKKSRNMAFKVGGATVESNYFCADMTDKDPCARSRRKEFASRGSFVTSSLIGDLLVTKQQLVKYDLGEVAHVENAMTGLEKQRTHRRLHRTEETELFESETITENERETQTTDRFDMEKESSKTLQQNFQIDAGVNVTGSYGTVNFTSSIDTSYGSSSLQSQSEATSFSKSVTTRALARVKETVRHSKTVTLFNELEETSVHKLSNLTGDNINGVYRWLDKFYLNKIINYGKRLMFEFAVPEPGQFYIFRQMAKPKSDQAVLKPTDPKATLDPSGHGLNTPSDISDTNYTFWASLYGATGLEVSPPFYLRVSQSWKNEYGTSQGGDIYDAFSTSFTVPKDYEATLAQVYCENYWWGAWDIHGTLGTTGFGNGYTVINLPNISQTIGIALLSQGMNWKINLILTCQRSAQLYAQWQIKTYNAIMDAYAARLREYQAWLQEQIDTAGDTAVIQGQNQTINRESEREELKKRCLELFTGQRFESFDAAVNGIYNVSGYPEILFAEAVREGNIAKFFEQAFDWANMTYIFYPYFWGRKSQWLSMKILEDPGDPLFTKFLQAGYARVVVPVRPDFENYLMLFHMFTNLVSSLGCSWNFQPSFFGAVGISNVFSPAINDPIYISVAQELQSAAGYTEETGPIYGTPYVQKVPTNLVYIAQNSHVQGSPWSGLPDNSADPDIAPYL